MQRSESLQCGNMRFPSKGKVSGSVFDEYCGSLSFSSFRDCESFSEIRYHKELNFACSGSKPLQCGNTRCPSKEKDSGSVLDEFSGSFSFSSFPKICFHLAKIICRRKSSRKSHFRILTFTCTVPFNDMRTLKFKIQPTVTLFSAFNHCSGPSSKRKRLAQRGQKVMFVRCDWRISIHFVGFCIFTFSQLSP